MKCKPSVRGTLLGYAVAILTASMATGIGFFIHDKLDHANLIMIYLAGVAVVASRFGRAESALCAVLSILAFDFLFVPPSGTLAVSDSQYILTFVIMLGVGLLISGLTHRVRLHAQAASERERRTAALYTLSQAMSRSRSKREISQAAAREIRSVFDVDAAVLVVEEVLAPSLGGFEREPLEAEAAAWCYRHAKESGKATASLPHSRGLYLPLLGAQGAVGVLGILPGENHWPLPAEQRTLLETFANGLGLALERTLLAKESHEAKLTAESERMRNALLSSISHDLRTPLTAIAGAASTLVEGQGDTRELASTIYEESMRLNLQVEHLLDMTRLQSGEVRPRLEWHSLEEIVGNALSRAHEILQGREVTADLPVNLPLVFVDGDLIEKVVINLLENASTHTPPGSPIDITADEMREYLRLNVSDHGPGIPKGEEVRIFERFSRQEAQGGFGLGLAICRAIMKLHHGRIWVENRSPGGAIFHVEIPKAEHQPEVPRG